MASLDKAIAKYQGAISLKNSESEIQWNRFNVMLVVNSLFLALTFTGISYNHIPLSLLHKIGSLLGILFCYLWFKMTKNGFYWTKHWIFEARKIEEKYFLEKDCNPIISGNKKREAKNEIINTAYAAYCIIWIIAGLYIYFLFTS